VDLEWSGDEFVDPGVATVSIATPPTECDLSVPVRTDLDRWLLLCELDALGALIVGVEAAGLVAAYRAQFPVLLGYEHQMLFDRDGSQLCASHQQYGFHQAEFEKQNRDTRGWIGVWDRVQRYLGGATDTDLGPFRPPFRPADRVAAMTHAYWTFVDRYDLTPPDIAERPS
jgi:hypothetical protein